FDGEGEAYAAHNVRTDARVNLHLLELGRGELVRLVEYVLGHCELAYVVQKRARFERRHLFARDSQKLTQLGRIQTRATNVAVSRLILRVNRNRERLDRFESKPRNLTLAHEFLIQSAA